MSEELRLILRDFVSVHIEFVPSNNPLMKKLDTLYLSTDVSIWAFNNPAPEITEYYEIECIQGDLIFRFANLDKIPDEGIDKMLQVLNT